MSGPLGREWIGGNGRTAWIFVPLVLFRNIQGIFFSSLQAAQRPVAYVLSAITRLMVLVAAGYWFVALHGEGVRGVLRCWLAGDGACVLILLVFCVPRMQLRVRKELLGPMLRYGFPLVWSALMALLLDASGRYFLARFQSLAEVGRYTVGIKITNILSMGFLQPFGNAWAGAVFPIAHRPNAAITYTKIMGYALLVGTLLSAMTILFGPFLIRIFAGRAYVGVQSLLPWLLLPVVFRLLEYWSSLPIYLKYKTKWLGPLANRGCGGLHCSELFPGAPARRVGSGNFLVGRPGRKHLSDDCIWQAVLPASFRLADLRFCGRDMGAGRRLQPVHGLARRAGRPGSLHRNRGSAALGVRLLLSMGCSCLETAFQKERLCSRLNYLCQSALLWQSGEECMLF